MNTTSDTNGDGVKGSLSIIGLKGTLGALTAQSVQEYKFAAQGMCPSGNAGFVYTQVAGADAVHRVKRTGDLIIGKFASSRFCFDPTTELFFVKGTQTVTGGTGRFTNARGSLEVEGVTKTLFEDAAGNYFGRQSGTVRGTIILP